MSKKPAPKKTESKTIALKESTSTETESAPKLKAAWPSLEQHRALDTRVWDLERDLPDLRADSDDQGLVGDANSRMIRTNGEQLNEALLGMAHLKSSVSVLEEAFRGQVEWIRMLTNAVQRLTEGKKPFPFPPYKEPECVDVEFTVRGKEVVKK